MEIQKFKEISSSVYSNIQALTPTDIQTLRDILRLDTINYGRIRTFSLEDSQAVILLTLKQNCLILIKFLLESGIDLGDGMLDDVINLLFAKKPGSLGTQQSPGAKRYESDLIAEMEKERIEKQIYNSIVDIVYQCRYANDRLKEFLASKSVPDDASVNFAPIVACEYKSFELIVLNQLVVGPVLLSLVKSYRHKLRAVVKKHIIAQLSKHLDDSDYGIIYQIFYLINESANNELLKAQRLENRSEYLGFAASLIRNKEAADIAYEKLLPFFEDFEYALSVLISSSKVEERKIQPKDEEMIERALECVARLAKFKAVNFYKFLASFQSVLKLKLGIRIKGLIYEILHVYVADKDVYIERILNCKDEIKQELSAKSYFLLPRIIKFINAYDKRERLECVLLANGKSLGSPYISQSKLVEITGVDYGVHGTKAPKITFEDAEKPLDYKVLALKSEDPTTVIECLNAVMCYETLKLNLTHVRNASIKDPRVVDKIVAYQIINNVVLEDVSIISMIACTPNQNFFKYARLFKDFSYYLNGDVLERITDDIEEGIKWLHDSYNREVGVFILRNCNFFNDILKGDSTLQLKMLPIYEKILNDNLGRMEILVRDSSNTDKEQIDTFLVTDGDDEISDEFFRIFTAQLLHAKFYNGTRLERFVIKRRFAHPGYINYLKAKIAAGFDVSADIHHMKAELVDTDELVGYFNIVSSDASKLADSNGKVGPNLLMNFGIKDSAYFLKNFPSASDFEKFILFFSLDQVNNEIECIIKDEIMKHLRSSSDIYLTMCVIQLFKCKDIDNILKILEKHFSDKELLFRLNINNILNGGHYCSKSLITQVDAQLMCKAIFILYYTNVWDRDYLIELASRVGPDASEDMRYLMEDLKKY